jgi:hypothetical protein
MEYYKDIVDEAVEMYSRFVEGQAADGEPSALQEIANGGLRMTQERGNVISNLVAETFPTPMKETSAAHGNVVAEFIEQACCAHNWCYLHDILKIHAEYLYMQLALIELLLPGLEPADESDLWTDC